MRPNILLLATFVLIGESAFAFDPKAECVQLASDPLEVAICYCMNTLGDTERLGCYDKIAAHHNLLIAREQALDQAKLRRTSAERYEIDDLMEVFGD